MKIYNEKKDRFYHRQVIKAIGLDNVPISFGAEKTCYIFNKFVVFRDFVGDKNEEKISDLLVIKIIKQQNAEYLANAGIQTPRIVDIEYKDGHIYEVQERAPGKVMSYTNESNILNTFGEHKYASIKDMSAPLRSELCMKVLQYNFTMQKRLKTAPISHFVKFVSSFRDILEYGLDLDIHGENFLYDTKQGFYFIDLPAMQSTQKKKFDVEHVDELDLSFSRHAIKEVERYRKVSDYSVAMSICSLFIDFLKYSGYVLDLDFVALMKKNNKAIIEDKLLPAFKKAGFKFTEQEWNNLNNYIKKFTHIKGEKREDTILLN